jgi:hypothetical protein
MGQVTLKDFLSKLPMKSLGPPRRGLKVLFGADPDRIGLLGKPPAVEHSFPSKSQ